MKYQVLENSHKRLVIKINYTDLRFNSFLTIGVGIAIAIANDLGYLAPIMAIFLKDFSKDMVILLGYISARLILLSGLFYWLISDITHNLTFDRNFQKFILEEKNTWQSSNQNYSLKGVTGVAYSKDNNKLGLWVKVGEKYKGKFIKLLTMSSRGSHVDMLTMKQTMDQFMTGQPFYIWEDAWIIDKSESTIKIIREFDQFILAIDQKQKLLSWQFMDQSGSLIFSEISELILETNQDDDDPSDRIVAVLTNSTKQEISPYYYKLTDGQYTPAFLRLLSEYISGDPAKLFRD